MADLKFDVWLINWRGTRYSRKHVCFDPNTSAAYWNFSFTEMGLYDLPKTIDYVLNITKTEKLPYVGHSEGAAVLLVTLSMRVKYNDKITIACLMGPLVYMQNLNPMLKTIFTMFAMLVRIGF